MNRATSMISAFFSASLSVDLMKTKLLLDLTIHSSYSHCSSSSSLWMWIRIYQRMNVFSFHHLQARPSTPKHRNVQHRKFVYPKRNRFDAELFRKTFEDFLRLGTTKIGTRSETSGRRSGESGEKTFERRMCVVRSEGENRHFSRFSLVKAKRAEELLVEKQRKAEEIQLEKQRKAEEKQRKLDELQQEKARRAEEKAKREAENA